MNMEYNRQVAVGGAIAAEAAKAKGTTADQRDMAFATVTINEKDNSGQQKANNVSSQPVVADTKQSDKSLTCCLQDGVRQQHDFFVSVFCRLNIGDSQQKADNISCQQPTLSILLTSCIWLLEN